MEWEGEESEKVDLLNDLLLGGTMTPEEIGIAKRVTDEPEYSLALLTGDDVNLVRVPSRVVSINGTVNSGFGKRTYSTAISRYTGCYVAPGETATVTIPYDLVGYITVSIGHYKSAVTFEMRKATRKIASPYGGLIVFWLREKSVTSKKGMFDVKVENVLEAPYFVYGEHTNEDWNRMSKLAAPWTILRVPGQMHITTETLKVKGIIDMEKIMVGVKDTMDVYDDMVGMPVGLQPGEEQVHYNQQTWGGWTISTGSNGVWFCTGAGFNAIGAHDYTNLAANFSSGIVFHEIGHRGCFSDLPDAGAQWNAELVMRYIQLKRGILTEDSWADPWNILYYMVGFRTFSKGKPCYSADAKVHFDEGIPFPVDSWHNCWEVLYRLPLQEFGWDVLRKVNTWNADPSQYEYIWNHDKRSKFNRLAHLYCRATGHNLMPLYHFFNLNPNSSVMTQCEKLPLPKLLTGYLKVANCILNKNIQDIECLKMPEFPAYSEKFRGICLLSGVCQTDSYFGNTTTTYNNTFDIYAKAVTRKNERYCHDRAKVEFLRCGNDKKHPITATFHFKNGDSTSRTIPLPPGNFRIQYFFQ